MPINHNEITEGELIDGDDYASNHVITNFLGYELIEEKILAAGTTTCTFSGLDGNSEEEYFIEGELTIVSTGGDGNVWIAPNGNTGNCSAAGQSSTTTGGGNLTDVDIRFCCGGWGQGSISKATTFLKTKSGKNRLFDTHVTAQVAGGNVLFQNISGAWKNSADNITSLVFPIVGGTYSGTIRLWKRIPIDGGN